jgi:hypothetical protein
MRKRREVSFGGVGAGDRMRVGGEEEERVRVEAGGDREGG